MSAEHSNPDYGMADKNLGIYIKGIIFCVILTLVPFAAVQYKDYFAGYVFVIIMISAILQFFVQLKCFLRLNYTTEQAKLNVLSFVLSIVLLLILVFGSLWIMWNLNYNMMH